MPKIDLKTLSNTKIKFSGKLTFTEAQQESAYSGENKGKIYFTTEGIVVGGNVVSDVTPIHHSFGTSTEMSKKVPTVKSTTEGLNKKIDNIVLNGNINSNNTISGGEKLNEIISDSENGLHSKTINIPEADDEHYGVTKQMKLSIIDEIYKNEDDTEMPSYNLYASARDVYEKMLSKADKSEVLQNVWK